MTLEDVLAKEEIREVVQKLARGTDRLDRELIVSCYHPDALDDHNEFRGPPDAFADWVLEVLPFFQATTHFIGAPAIELDGDSAWVETYCVAHHVMRPDEAGAANDMVLGLRYVDRFERRAEAGWRIAHRVCAFDWSYTVPIAADATWNFREDFTVGQRDTSDVSYRRGQP
jgi:hypothetical protein